MVNVSNDLDADFFVILLDFFREFPVTYKEVIIFHTHDICTRTMRKLVAQVLPGNEFFVRDSQFFWTCFLANFWSKVLYKSNRYQ